MYSICITFPAQIEESQVALLGGALEDVSPAHTALRKGGNNDQDAPWLLTWITEEPLEFDVLQKRLACHVDLYGISMPDILDFEITAIPEDTDWLSESYKGFEPFEVGRFYLYGSHINDAPPADKIPLQIDAATAFGSGEHGTTKGCLMAMEDMYEAGIIPCNTLDMGCGSGILAIAAYKLWQKPVLAIDIDEEAVRVTEEHAKINQTPLNENALSAARGESFEGEAIAARQPFDLIIANILAGTLIDLAEGLASVRESGGAIILSGILEEQKDAVLAAYKPYGLSLQKTYALDGWVTLVLG